MAERRADRRGDGVHDASLRGGGVLGTRGGGVRDENLRVDGGVLGKRGAGRARGEQLLLGIEAPSALS